MFSSVWFSLVGLCLVCWCSIVVFHGHAMYFVCFFCLIICRGYLRKILCCILAFIFVSLFVCVIMFISLCVPWAGL